MNDSDQSMLDQGMEEFDFTDAAGPSDTMDARDAQMEKEVRAAVAHANETLLGISDSLPESARPEAVRGMYSLPDPNTGKPRRWSRMTSFIKLCESHYHLGQWQLRNVAKGVSMMPGSVHQRAAKMHVKADKARLGKLAADAMELAGAHVNRDEGTALHKSTEIIDFAGSTLDGWASLGVPERHLTKMRLYLDCLKVNGLTVARNTANGHTMIERATVSARYGVAGKFDRIMMLADGSFVLVDLKTGDDLEYSLPSIAGQLAGYQDGINTHGVWDGERYDTGVKVREDFALVIHLPSTRDEVSVHEVKLPEGHDLLEDCARVRARQKVKAADVSREFDPSRYQPRMVSSEPLIVAGDRIEQHWIERFNAAHTVDELMSLANRARGLGQYSKRLGDVARSLAGELS